MSLIGYIGLIAGCGAMGLWMANRIRNRPKELREFMMALTLLDTEILWGATPLPEAFGSIGQKTGEPWQAFFYEVKARIEMGEVAGKAWTETIKKQEKHFSLKLDDWRIISDLGKGLGRSDRQEQHKQIDLILRQLNLVREQAMSWADKNARMWSYLGFLTGTAMVILLI